PRPEETEYKWLANGMSTPILKVITNLGIISSIEYQDTLPVVGVDELTVINGVSVFPNPTKEFVQVIFNSKNAGSLAYSIKDINGKIILNNNYKATIGKNVFVIDLRNNKLTKGVYFIELTMNNQLATQKLVLTE
ncbi:MAG TPA: T9SS type A sorting domain-containing protein, partial [Vicingus sp.]|nr:T9SS type A sorting domain-containing protein [Vicingus sp.]